MSNGQKQQVQKTGTAMVLVLINQKDINYPPMGDASNNRHFWAVMSFHFMWKPAGTKPWNRHFRFVQWVDDKDNVVVLDIVMTQGLSTKTKCCLLARELPVHVLHLSIQGLFMQMRLKWSCNGHFIPNANSAIGQCLLHPEACIAFVMSWRLPAWQYFFQRDVYTHQNVTKCGQTQDCFKLDCLSANQSCNCRYKW